MTIINYLNKMIATINSEVKEILNYRHISYFNLEDYFITYNDGLKKYNVTKLQFYNGSYFSILGLEYKMTSIPCINLKEVKGATVKYKGTELLGAIAKHNQIGDYIGVIWESGPQVKKFGLPYYWNNVKNLEI